MNKLLERRFCIVGLGLLGGTYAMCLKRLGCRVTAVDIDEKATLWAEEHGVIDEGAARAPEMCIRDRMKRCARHFLPAWRPRRP